ncbi:response regulator [Pseudooceanicola sp. CBS1P-1]|uniref:Response regulator n=1 Tax=Pseudooceanicola albus TaxID=2692189 RepID=A0A6L7G3I5_9RHOB|nr:MULTISPECIES: response regulator [Pseudooceanicola]MBT9385032.1 response regulator [Pseudooceanicola endophyticus]MXN18675.1 response regulator [Pseudooceanicola albus]
MAAGRTVMLIDDNVDFLSIASEALDMLGYAVEALSDPDRALVRVAEGPAFDILVVDLNLGPGPSGRHLAEAALAARPGLPVILLTGAADPQHDHGPAITEVVAKTAGILALKAALERVSAPRA